ncbi:MAG: hypothetical protein MK010_04465 [Erythrobacter sp.]|nr:hypothetical protein [Erythrobacter sp.]
MVGAVLGWLGSILLRREDRGAVLTLAGAGIVGALLAGAVLGNANLLAAVGAHDLLYAVIGAVVAIGIADAARQRAFR